MPANVCEDDRMLAGLKRLAPASGTLPRVALRQHWRDVLARCAAAGNTDVRVFGSVARGEDQPDSDIDLLVVAPAGTTLLDLGRVQEDLKDLLECSVDVMTIEDIASAWRGRVQEEAISLKAWAEVAQALRAALQALGDIGVVASVVAPSPDEIELAQGYVVLTALPIADDDARRQAHALVEKLQREGGVRLWLAELQRGTPWHTRRARLEWDVTTGRVAWTKAGSWPQQQEDKR